MVWGWPQPHRLYLVRIHPAFIMGLILLGIVWWCAHKLTWDCTLIDEDEDASGGGLLETVGKEKKLLALDKAAKIKTAGTDTPTGSTPPTASFTRSLGGLFFPGRAAAFRGRPDAAAA